MQSYCIDLTECSFDLIDLVGGKAAGLGELIRLGERVPPGFCVTTSAAGIPEAEIAAAYDRLGGGPVAVRSSATAEDLPDASFAGQHDTFLGVTGIEEVVAAIAKCRASVGSARAVAYREAREINPATVRMAVIVQRMVDAETAGVLFTANPLTGRRTEMLVDAARGLGTAVVDGASSVDHYVLSSDADHRAPGGALTRAQLAELRGTGERLQRLFGVPQDIEWAIDGAGTVWLVQSRAITTLFALPPQTGDLRIYLEFGHVQGMLQPVTPMGMATLRKVVAAMVGALGIRVEIVDIGGRLYGDLTELARGRSTRKRLVKLLAVDFGPRAQAVMQHVLADPRFAPGTGGRSTADRVVGDRAMADRATGDRATGGRVVGDRALGEQAVGSQGTGRRKGTGSQGAGRRAGSRASWVEAPGTALLAAGRVVSGIVRALARPDAARARMSRAIEELRVASVAPDGLRTTADRLRFVREDGAGGGAGEITWPIVAGMLAAALPAWLLKGVAEAGEIHTVLSGVPHNVTIEMDLALWRLAEGAGQHRRLLLDTLPSELAGSYLRGELPEIGLAGFLASYGHRGLAEADLGVPRWAEDPAPVFAAIANYLRLTDPGQAPDQRYARAAATAEATLDRLATRARRRRPVRGRIAVFLLRRARSLTGLRESGKFAGLYRLQAVRRQLLLIGADLTGAGLLAEPADIMFLTLDEADDAVHRHADHRDTVAVRKALHRTESRRRTVPVALLSDGTDVEATLPAVADPEGVLRGVGAAAGRVTGPARVIHDPATAHIEPGEILVAATTDPGWTPLFLTAAALVTETGAIMAHGPTVAREYGIPAVISVPGATTQIATGQIISVDGAAGTVTLTPPAP